MQTEALELLELTSDTTFKAFMMSKNTNALKARMIHLITGIDEELLLKAEYQSIELPVKKKKDKVYKSDIVIKIGNSILNIEMNAGYYPEFQIKNGEYIHVLASELFESGEKYDNRTVIQINLDDFDAYGLNELIYEFRIMEVKYHIIEDENYVSYHINLSKTEEICYTGDENEELVNILKLFKAKNEEELNGLRGEEYMDEAINEIRRICRDKKIIGLYDAEKVAKKEMNNRLDYAKQQGYDEGIEQRNIEIARNLLKAGVNIEVIIGATGLSKKQIEDLK